MEYARHQPEETLLYEVIDEYYPEFLSHLSASDKTLPQYVQNEFEAYLKCGRLEHGFCGCNATHVHTNNWSRSVVSAVVFVRAVAQSEWWRVRHYWWTQCFHAS